MQLKHQVLGTGYYMEHYRGQPAQKKIEIQRKLQNIDHAHRARWSGQGYINKPVIVIIVMYVLKHNGLVGCGHFCNLKLKTNK